MQAAANYLQRSIPVPWPLMFVSLPEYRFPVPTQLAAPGASYWRSLALSTTTPWYVLTVRAEEGSPTDTFLLVWDSDLVQAIKTSDMQVESLLLLRRTGSPKGWRSVEIAEVWEASDPEDEGTQVLLVDEVGSEYSGLFMQPTVGVKRIRLVTKLSDRKAAPPTSGVEL